MESAVDIDIDMTKTYVESCRVHFDDLDPFGQLYNGRYFALLDRGFQARMEKQGIPWGHEDLYVVLRETTFVFAEPIRGLGLVDLIFWVSEFSRSTATFQFIVKSGDTLHLCGNRIFTKFDPATNRSKPWSNRMITDFLAPVTLARSAIPDRSPA